MHTIRRPYGRFFVVLIVWLACVAPRAVAADGAGSPPAAPSAGGIHQLSVVSGRLSVKPALGTVLLKPLHAYFDNGLQLTQITDTVYYANGSKAKGTLLISWPSFTTASQNVVAAGSLGVTLGADGLFSASLAPTTGSTPTGVYYTVVYQLGDGSNKQEFWAVPATDSTTISAVRAKLVPTTQAAQFLTRDVADSAYVHVNDDQTVGGVKTFVKSPAVPNPANPSDAINMQYADAGYVHANDDQTVGGVKTFVKSPAVPDPANSTDAANKEYVDANAGQANLSSPPPIGTGTPNTVIGSSIASSAGAGGDANFNALKTWVDGNGQISLDITARDGSTTLTMAKYMPWFQAPFQPAGWLDIPVPVTAWNYVGGMPMLGRLNTYQLPDPGPGTCTMTHSGGSGSGAGADLRFVDSDSAYSLPTSAAGGACFDPQGFTYAQLVAGHGALKNIIHYKQPGIGYSDVIMTRCDGPTASFCDPINSVVNDPSHLQEGVLSGITSCLEKTGCDWVDDGSWSNTTLSNLAGVFLNSPDDNTTSSGIFGGRLWGQRGMNLSGGTYLFGRTTVDTLSRATLNVTAQPNRTGAIPYTYYVVVHDYGTGTFPPLGPFTISNGAVPPNNSISLYCIPFFASWDILKGDTSHALATNLPCQGPSGDGYPHPYIFTDTGQATILYNAPTRDSTRDLHIAGNIDCDAANDCGIFGKYLAASNNVAGPTLFGWDQTPGHGYITLTSGDSSHPGYLGWYKADGTRTFHFGYDASNDVTLTSDNGGSFDIAALMNATSIAVTGDLTARDIPGHAYFVSKYPGIQAAINAAYGTGTVSGAVIDDRTVAYSGPGFYIPDSVTVRLAPVPYSFTSAVTHNNGNNNVTAAIVVEQGAHLAGGGTSSNHGTTITVGSGFATDIIATTSVGTGTGAGVQWWHWGSIENLNVDGTNQTAGECVHVENMGETSKVRDLLVKNCYGNNIEFVGAAATQSDIGNLTSNRSRNGSGVRFTNLSGVGKINGLSGDCNAGSLASVQENAAGTLVITGLKSEAESTICSNGSAHDPVVLLDTLPGLNTHVHITGGYAFGTAQNAVAKVVGSGGGILEMEGFYVTGYTDLLNDTVRGVVVPATSMNSKQPFYYEPNGIVFANQAFTLTPGTGVMGGSTSLTPIFYATTGNATMVASLGNGDGQSIMTGGVELAGQNRTMYGATPEVMARAGYRFTGTAYDTTKWDLVPAWNTGDTTEKNLGNALTVCQKSGSVSCRWNHVYGVNVDALVFTLGTYTVGTLPVSYGVGSLAWVNDGASSSDCTAGHGSTRVLCYYTGPAWTALTTGGTQVQSDWNEANSGQPDYIKNKPTIPAQGMHLVTGTMVGPQGGVVGNGADQNVFSVTVPAGTVSAGTGFKCSARFSKLSTSNSITFKWVLGATTLATQSVTSGSTNWMGEVEVFTPSSLSSEVADVGALLAGTTIQSGPQVGLTASENLANASTLKLTFNATSAETITPKTFYCTTIQ